MAEAIGTERERIRDRLCPDYHLGNQTPCDGAEHQTMMRVRVSERKPQVIVPLHGPDDRHHIWWR